MKGDFSRLGPWPDDSVTGVWLQQGRPLLDADWNDLQTVLRRMAARTLDTVLGGPAGPARDLGFEVRVLPRFALNIDGASGQRLSFDPSPSLPFGGIAVEELIEEDEIGADASLPAVLVALRDEIVVHERGDRPYAVELDLDVMPGASGVILRRPGHVGIGLHRDGRLWLGGDTGERTTARLASAGTACRLALVYCGHRYCLFLDEDVVAEWRGAATGERQGAALTIGAEPDGTAPLACRLVAVRLWRIRRRRDLSWRLVADLDLGAGDGRRVPDRTRFDNAARIDGERAAPAPLDLRLGPGRYVVGGTPLVNPRPVSLGLGAVSAMRGAGLVYLEAGERCLGALEDPRLREVALGGADTVMQTRSVWKVGMVTGPDADAAWAAFHELASAEGGRAAFEHAASPAGNSLYRAEVHDPGWSYSWPLGPRARAAARRITPAAADRLVWPPGDPPPRAGAPLLAFCDGADPWILRVAGDGTSSGEVTVTGGPAPWPAGDLSVLRLASFKWSPNNAAAAFDVAGITAIHDPQDGRLGQVQLASAGFNGLDLRAGDWAELSGPSDAGHGRLYPIAGFDSGLMQVDLAGWDDPPSHEARILRRWGPMARGARDGAYPVLLSTEATALDADVSIRFEPDARFAEGAAWTLPLRQPEDDDWTSPNRRTGWLAADGPARTFAPLALIRAGESLEIEDLRRSFHDLPTLSAAAERRPPPPERRVDTAEASRWLRRHLPGARLVGAGPPPAGFRAAGEVLCTTAPGAARWQGVDTSGWAPGGPGRAVFVGGGVIFIEDGRPGAWRWTERTRWIRLKDQPEPRTGFALVAVGGGVAIVGGSSIRGDRLCDTVDVMVPGGEWTRVACGATPGLHPGAAMLGSLLYVTGGFDGDGTPMRRCEAVDLRTGGAFDAGALRQARADHGMAAIGDVCWVFGGVAADGREIAEAEAYDGALDRWRAIAPLKLPLSGPVTAVIGSAVAVAGGTRRDRPLDEAAIYEPAFDRWTALPRLPAVRRRMGLAAEPPGIAGEARLLLIGGDRSEGHDMMELVLGRRLPLWASEGDETWP